MTIYLIDGKPHRLCDCDEHTELCPRGGKRELQTYGFSRCFVPAPDAIYAAVESAADPALPGLELAAWICDAALRLPSRDQYEQGANDMTAYFAKTFRAEIERRTK